MEGGQGEGWCSIARGDVAALIGLCAVLEGHLQAEPEELAHLSRHLGARLVADGASSGAYERAVRQAVNDLNHRLRYALGEYPEAPKSVPVAPAGW